MTEPTLTASAGGQARTSEDVRQAVRAVVFELSPERDETAGPDTRLVDDLGFHSLALLELAFTLEDEFDLEPIEEGTARRITTIGRLEEHVLKQLTARGEIV